MKPTPTPNADSQSFWNAATEGKLMYQVCKETGKAVGLPCAVSPFVPGGELVWKQASGTGRVASYSIVHRASTPAFREHVPFVLALVDFDEGFRLMLNVIGEDRESVEIGDAVKVAFETRGGEGMKIPQVERVRS